MDAVLFLKEWKRMCEFQNNNCSGCAFTKLEGGFCRVSVYNHPDDAVKYLEEWSRENPVKTMMDDFFEKFPNAPKDEDGTPIHCCPCYVGYVLNRECPQVDGREIECLECWSRPLEVTK